MVLISPTPCTDLGIELMNELSYPAPSFSVNYYIFPCSSCDLPSSGSGHHITALPPPPPFLTLGRRNGYFPLLVSIIKAHFSTSLPPGVDTVWFEYKGLPLKWYIPIGVLFDLLSTEPERPWNLTVHFRGYPADILSPCEDEDSVKWNYNNSLKEAAFIITGNSKSVMNMSQADQVAMWESARKGDLDSYLNISTKLKLGPFEEVVQTSSLEPQQGSNQPESPGSVKPCRVPVRLYVRRVQEDLEYLEDAIPVCDWESVSYINQPLEIQKEGGRTLEHALKTLLPEFFSLKPTAGAADPGPAAASDSSPGDSDTTPSTPRDEKPASVSPQETEVPKKIKVKLVRVQGIEVGMETPFLWVANLLKNPEGFLHICVYIGA